MTSDETTWHGFDLPELPEVSKGIEYLGRAGHFAKGIVYFIVGILAFRLAIGAGGEITDTRGAIREIGQQPFGRMLLGLIAAGLIAYTLWRLVQAAMDTEGHRNTPKGIGIRIGYAISGLAYLSLGCFAGSRALGLGSGGGQGGGATQTALLDSVPGRVLLGIAGLVVLGLGFYFFYKAYQADFMRRYDWRSMSDKMRMLALRVGRAGLTTRGVAFVLIGWFLATAAYRGTSGGEVSGLSDALAVIASQPYGQVLLGLTGAGLMCYGIHMLLMGWYRRFNVVRR